MVLLHTGKTADDTQVLSAAAPPKRRPPFGAPLPAERVRADRSFARACVTENLP